MSWNNYSMSDFGLNTENVSSLFRGNTTSVAQMFEPLDIECGNRPLGRFMGNKGSDQPRKLTQRELVNIFKALMLNGQDPGFHATQQRIVFNKAICDQLNIEAPGLQDYNRAYEMAERDCENIMQGKEHERRGTDSRDSIVKDILSGTKKPESFSTLKPKKQQESPTEERRQPTKLELQKLMSQIMANGGLVLRGENGYNQIARQAAWKTYQRMMRWEEPSIEDWNEALKAVERQDKVVQNYLEANSDNDKLPAVAEQIRSTVRSQHNNAKIISLIANKKPLPQLTDYRKSFPINPTLANDEQKTPASKTKLALNPVGEDTYEGGNSNTRELLNVVKAYYALGGNPERGKVPEAVRKFVEHNGNKYRNLKNAWSQAVFQFDTTDRSRFNNVMRQFDAKELRSLASDPNASLDARSAAQEFLSHWGDRMEKKYADDSKIDLISKFNNINAHYNELLDDANEDKANELEDYLTDRPWIIKGASNEYGLGIEYPQNDEEAREVAGLVVSNPDLLGEEGTDALDSYYNVNQMDRATAIRNYQSTEQHELGYDEEMRYFGMLKELRLELQDVTDVADIDEALPAFRPETKEDAINRERRLRDIQDEVRVLETNLANDCNRQGCPGTIAKFSRVFNNIKSELANSISKAETDHARLDPNYVPPIAPTSGGANLAMPEQKPYEIRNTRRQYNGATTAVMSEDYGKQLSAVDVRPQFNDHWKEAKELEKTVRTGLNNPIDARNAINRLNKLQDQVTETQRLISRQCEDQNITRGLSVITDTVSPLLTKISNTLKKAYVVKHDLENKPK